MSARWCVSRFSSVRKVDATGVLGLLCSLRRRCRCRLSGPARRRGAWVLRSLFWRRPLELLSPLGASGTRVTAERTLDVTASLPPKMGSSLGPGGRRVPPPPSSRCTLPAEGCRRGACGRPDRSSGPADLARRHLDVRLRQGADQGRPGRRHLGEPEPDLRDAVDGRVGLGLRPTELEVDSCRCRSS